MAKKKDESRDKSPAKNAVKGSRNESKSEIDSVNGKTVSRPAKPGKRKS